MACYAYSVLTQWFSSVCSGAGSETPLSKESKHIDIRKHFAHEVIQNGQMRLVKVPTSAQMADILTKGLHLQQVLACVDGLLQRSTTSLRT